MSIYDGVEGPVQRFNIDIECNNCGRFATASNVPLRTDSHKRIMCRDCGTGQAINVSPGLEIGELATWGRRFSPSILDITVGMTRVA